MSLRRLLKRSAVGAMEMSEVLKYLGRDGMIAKREDYLESAFVET